MVDNFFFFTSFLIAVVWLVIILGELDFCEVLKSLLVVFVLGLLEVWFDTTAKMI